MSYELIYSPEARAQLLEIATFISETSSIERSNRFTAGLIEQCEQLLVFPRMGVLREDLKPGIRILTYRNRVVIAYSVVQEIITILDFSYAGRDYAQRYI